MISDFNFVDLERTQKIIHSQIFFKDQIEGQKVNIWPLKCGFWVGAKANPPKSDDIYAQLTRGAFIINDFLQNPHFNNFLGLMVEQVYIFAIKTVFT